MNKLFIHLFANYIERYQDSNGALREIDAILKTDEDVLYANLRDAIQQAHRIRICKENGIGLSYDSMGSHIDNKNIPKDVLEQLLEIQVEIPQLKKFINAELIKRK